MRTLGWVNCNIYKILKFYSHPYLLQISSLTIICIIIQMAGLAYAYIVLILSLQH